METVTSPFTCPKCSSVIRVSDATRKLRTVYYINYSPPTCFFTHPQPGEKIIEEITCPTANCQEIIEIRRYDGGFKERVCCKIL